MGSEREPNRRPPSGLRDLLAEPEVRHLVQRAGVALGDFASRYLMKANAKADAAATAEAAAEAKGSEPEPAADDAPLGRVSSYTNDWDRPLVLWAAELAQHPPDGMITLKEAYERWSQTDSKVSLARLLQGIQCVGHHIATGENMLPGDFASSMMWVVDPDRGWARMVRDAPMLQYAFFVMVPEQPFMRNLSEATGIDFTAKPHAHDDEGHTHAPPRVTADELKAPMQAAKAAAHVEPPSPPASTTSEPRPWMTSFPEPHPCVGCRTVGAYLIHNGIASPDACQFHLCPRCVKVVTLAVVNEAKTERGIVA